MEQPEHRERWDNLNTAKDEAIWAHWMIGQTERGEAWANFNTARDGTVGRQQKWTIWTKWKIGRFERMKDRTIRTQRGSDLLLKRRKMTRKCMKKKKSWNHAVPVISVVWTCAPRLLFLLNFLQRFLCMSSWICLGGMEEKEVKRRSLMFQAQMRPEPTGE